MLTHTQQLHPLGGRGIARKLEAAGWGTFFIWVAIAILAEFAVGIALLGVGAITLAGQAARKFFALGLEGFWVVVGLSFLIGGLGQLFAPRLPLVPVLLLLAGGALIVAAVRGRGDAEEER